MAGSETTNENFVLKLYVTELTAPLREAIAMLESICRDELSGCYQLQVIDVREHPEMAAEDRVLATPTLIKELPPPLRRVIGDLSDRERTLIGLALSPQGRADGGATHAVGPG